LFELCNNLLLYAPACKKADFIHAIGYLVRRLDENTGPNNFLRHAFHLIVDSPDWERLEQQYFDGFDRIKSLTGEPRRHQDRRQPPPPTPDRDWQDFYNEPDTDFALPHNVSWAEQLVAKWKGRHGDAAVNIPLTIAGKEVSGRRNECDCHDPSRPNTVVGRYRQANSQDIAAAIECAVADEDGWRAKSATERRDVLCKVAEEIRKARGDLMGAAIADGGKTLPQSDPEVSEAVDFVEFYGQTAEYFAQLDGVEAQGRGVIVVVSPWNFPIAIPCGGVAAALAAGNTVILKPASDTVLVAHELCQCFWRAGVSQKVLQLLPCSGRVAGEHLITSPHVDTVILTGGTDTALTMLATRPDLRLLAETGGKNATVVTAMADRDQAIKDVIDSAFGHAGQKCSATSLLILETEIYEDESFKRTLCDAAQSMKVGSAWEFESKIGPLIRPPGGVLETSLKELEQGESWALMPQHDDENPHLQGPGIKWGVQPGSFTHCTEFFGPLLGVMKAKDIHEAIDLVNQTGYGLTSGLQSLDDREQEIWRSRIRAGNLYVNRGTTGAIVLRQPFGGMGKSAFGPGIKAGGPNYVAQLIKFSEIEFPAGNDEIGDPQLANLKSALQSLTEEDSTAIPPETVDRLIAAIGSYDREMIEEFGRSHDHFKLIGQDNFRRYLPVKEIRIRIHKHDSAFETIARVSAARAAGCRITVSSPPGLDRRSVDWLDRVTADWAAMIEFVQESDDELARVVTDGETLRVRYAAHDRVPEIVHQAAAQTGLYVADSPVLMHGRIELLWYFEEQSISDNYHRYGNLGSRADEPRASVL
jgi:RHH-type proline utilization regulon transcriptional repressor/proline dehydrogenase/delta 1-pyrroline-5-carboxylate dehydrogenase